MTEYGVITGGGGGDGGLFNAILARYLAFVVVNLSWETHEDLRARELAAQIVLSSAEAAWNNRLQIEGLPLFGHDWTKDAQLPESVRRHRHLRRRNGALVERARARPLGAGWVGGCSWRRPLSSRRLDTRVSVRLFPHGIPARGRHGPRTSSHRRRWGRGGRSGSLRRPGDAFTILLTTSWFRKECARGALSRAESAGPVAALIRWRRPLRTSNSSDARSRSTAGSCWGTRGDPTWRCGTHSTVRNRCPASSGIAGARPPQGPDMVEAVRSGNRAGPADTLGTCCLAIASRIVHRMDP